MFGKADGWCFRAGRGHWSGWGWGVRRGASRRAEGKEPLAGRLDSAEPLLCCCYAQHSRCSLLAPKRGSRKLKRSFSALAGASRQGGWLAPLKPLAPVSRWDPRTPADIARRRPGRRPNICLPRSPCNSQDGWVGGQQDAGVGRASLCCGSLSPCHHGSPRFAQQASPATAGVVGAGGAARNNARQARCRGAVESH